MPEQVQKILNKIVDWWKAFNTKQKILISSLTATVILALVILAAILSQPEMTELVVCESTAQAAEVKELLEENGDINYQIEDDNLTFLVEVKDKSTAALLLGQNSIPTSDYSIDNVFDGSFSTTEADKTKKYKLYLEEHYAESLELFDNVESAQVNLELPDQDGTILAKEEEASATAIVTLSTDMDADQAYGIAQFLATNLGNKDTSNIVIMDSSANVLYSGTDSTSAVGTASNQLSLREKAEQQIINKVKEVMKNSSLCDNVEVAPKLDMNFDASEEASHSYALPDGQTAGLPSTTYDYESNAVGGAAATPGTDSNDDTTYVMEDGEYTESSVTESKREYYYDETITNTTKAIGTYNYENSSISLVTTNYVLYSEDILKANGELDDMTFEEYKAANGARVKVDVDEELYQMVANATGFPVENITIMSYEEPVFEASAGSGRSIADYLQIALAVLIFAVLGFVVFRSTRGEKEAELEEELSVESLLESTKESQQASLEDIGFNEKSETRILIEKFVDENPEAVASLLRNWLNEEWE